MAYSYYIDPEVNCVFTGHYDEYIAREGFEITEQILKDPLHSRGMNIIRDTRETSFPKSFADLYSVSQVRQNIEKFDSALGPCRVVWVVGSSSDYAIVHRWTVSTRLSGSVERNLFRDIAKAKEWLGIPEDYKISFPPIE